MSQSLFVRDDIVIDTPMSIVWDVLVNPEKTRRYMYGCEVVTDWKIGSPVLWKMQYEGQEITPVKGFLIAFDEGKTLEYTVIDPQGKYEDIPENYLHVTYTLSGEEGKTLLTITQGDYATVADGAKRYADTQDGGGWSTILAAIKDVAEETAESNK